MEKPREFKIGKDPLSNVGIEEVVGELKYFETVHVIEKSAYDKAIEALKYVVKIESGYNNESDYKELCRKIEKCEETLKELGVEL